MIQLIYPEERYLWKFLDLYKLISFIKTKEIVFSRLDQFDDEMEICSEDMAFRIKSDLRIAEFTKEQQNPKIANEDYEKRGRDFIHKINSLKGLQQLFYGSCFYAANEESLVMWKLYAGVQGVAIKFDSTKLLENLVKNHKESTFKNTELGGAKMNYINLSNNSPYDGNGDYIKLYQGYSPYNKDISYKHENEYRFILVNSKSEIDSSLKKLKIDLDEQCFDFIISPETESWKIDLVDKLISENGINKKVKKSEIITKEVITKYKLRYLQDLIGNSKFQGRRYTEYFSKYYK